MAYFEDSLQAYLLTQSLSAYPLYAPQKAVFPRITYTLQAEERTAYLDGTTGLVVADYYLTCWSEDYSDNQANSRALYDALHGFYGTMGSFPIANIELINTVEQYNPPIANTDRGVFQRVCEYRFSYQEPFPTNETDRDG